MGETLASSARHERACGNRPKLEAARCAAQVAFFYLSDMIEAGPAQQVFTAPKLKQTQDHVTGWFG